ARNSGKKVRNFCALFRAINSLQNLERLKLYYKQPIFNYHLPIPENFQYRMIDLPILSQLRFFHFNTKDHADVLFRSLQTYATPNHNLPIVDVRNFSFLNEPDDRWLSTFMARFLTVNCRLSERTSSLIANAVKVELMAATCTPQYNFAQCIRLFARLPALEVLSMRIPFSIEHFGFMHEFSQLTRVSAPCLANLKVLKLTISDPTSHELFNLPTLA